MTKRREEKGHKLVELPYQIFYFAFYAGYMPLLLYLPVYLKYIGLGPVQVGTLYGIRPILQAVGTPCLVLLGEKLRARKLLFIISSLVMIGKILIIFLFLRPGWQLCTIKYVNASDITVKETSHFVEHRLTRRSLVTDDWLKALNLRDASNQTIAYRDTTRKITDKEEAKTIEEYDRKRGLLIASGNKSVSGQKSANENRTLENEIKPGNNTPRSNASSFLYPILSNRSRSTEAPQNENAKKLKREYEIIDDKEEVYHIYIGLLILVVLGDWFDAAVFTLVDHSCAASTDKERYGFVRLWGNVGWGLMTPIIGVIVYKFDHEMCGKMIGSFHYVFYFFIGFSYIALLVGSHLDYTLKPTDAVSQKIHNAQSNFQYGMFLFASSFSGFCNGFFFTFANWFIDSLGGNALIMGIATGCKCLVDIGLFFLLASIIEYLGYMSTMSLGFIGHIVVFLIYYGIKNPWLVVLAETIHALFYGLMTSTTISFLIFAAPAGSSPRMQAILHGIYWGLGTGAGSIFGGYCLDSVGYPQTFLSFTVLSCVVALVFLVIQFFAYMRDRETPDDIVSESSNSFDGDDEAENSSGGESGVREEENW